MGVKHFFPWFRKRFSDCIKTITIDQELSEVNVSIDGLYLDLNGIIHTVAQKILKYGKHDPGISLLRSPKPITHKDLLRVYKAVCEEIERLIAIVEPKKKLILCVDGIAGASKLAQQRQRRFRTAKEREEKEETRPKNTVFDSNCITPGTEFMDHLTKYIDWFIRRKIRDSNLWKGLEVVLSNEKVPGEGEHKIINYIRHYGTPEESYCIHGSDADLIMILLGTKMQKAYILREDHYNDEKFYVLDIGMFSVLLKKELKWDSNINFNSELAINDFIFMCFMVGNDFVPQIPTLEILQGGIDILIDVYKNVGASYGHLTKYVQKKVIIDRKALEIFLGTIGQYEKGCIEEKLNKKDSFFPDPLLDKHVFFDKNGYAVRLEDYKKEYYQTKLSGLDKEKICHDYLEGLQWVLSYYTTGIPSWTWFYRYHYAPYPTDLARYIKTFSIPSYRKTYCLTCFQQLLAVLPRASVDLIPQELRTLVTLENSPLKDFYPKKFEVDLSGKRQEWEGIVILPFVDFDRLKTAYRSKINDVSERDLKRERRGKSYIYKYSPERSYLFKSYYGDLYNCPVLLTQINL